MSQIADAASAASEFDLAVTRVMSAYNLVNGEHAGENRLWKPLDVPIAEEAAALDLNITRWVDDISVSGDDPRPIISQRDLRMYRAKAQVSCET